MYGSRWPTPGLLDAARFACTEAAEVMDAWLRMKGYSRNTERCKSMDDEAADCALMLLTVLGDRWWTGWNDEDAFVFPLRHYRDGEWIDCLMMDAATVLSSALMHYRHNGRGWLWQSQAVMRGLMRIAQRPEFDLEGAIGSRLARIAVRLDGQQAAG